MLAHHLCALPVAPSESRKADIASARSTPFFSINLWIGISILVSCSEVPLPRSNIFWVSSRGTGFHRRILAIFALDSPRDSILGSCRVLCSLQKLL